MFINPQDAINNGWITGDIQEDNIQPNGIDFTLDHLSTISGEPCAIVDYQDPGQKSLKIMRSTLEQEPKWIQEYQQYAWCLFPNKTYDGMSDLYLDLPEDVSAFIITRSTLNRNQIFITSGLWDSGFQGHIGFAIHNSGQEGGEAFIGKGTRVGQIVFVESSCTDMYDGDWSHGQGTHWAERPG